jgi:predicted nucleic acid-binding Zn ribbon protein
MSNKQAATASNVGNDDSRMLDDEDEKGQGPSVTGPDQFPSPLQQLKALFNKLDAESKQRRWIPPATLTTVCSTWRLEHERFSFGRL